MAQELLAEMDLKDVPETAQKMLPDGFKVYKDVNQRLIALSPTRKMFILMVDEKGNVGWPEITDIKTIPVRELMIKQALVMEIKFNMRATRKAPKATTILRKEYGMKGTPLRLYMQWCRFRGYDFDGKILEMAMKEGVR